MSDATRTDIEQTELRLRLEKLELEIQQLRQNVGWNRIGGRVLPIFASLVPALALVFAVQQFVAQQRAGAAAAQRQQDADQKASERAFMQPILSRQMNTYFDVSGAAATLASSTNATEKSTARETFWRIYWGPLVMLESPEVSRAMMDFGECLNNAPACADSLQNLSLALASTLETDLFASWKLSPEQYAQRSIDYAAARRKR